jgi:hypothetical protein
MASLAIIGAAAASGAVWGGGTAISNYFVSFRKNMIESNQA